MPFAGEPIARAHQPADIGQMIADVVARRTDRVGVRAVRRPARRACDACRSARCTSGPADLGEELVVEPAGEPAHLDARDRVSAASAGARRSSAPRVSSRYSAIIGGARHRRMALLDQHRRGAGGIEHQNSSRRSQTRSSTSAASRPYSAERQAHEARMRAEWVMEQRQHESCVIGALGTGLRQAGISVAMPNRHIPAKVCSGSRAFCRSARTLPYAR